MTEQIGLFSDDLQNYCLSVSCIQSNGAWDYLCVIEDTLYQKDFTVVLQETCKRHDINQNAIFSYQSEKIDMSTNWLEQSYEALPAFEIGDFYIYGNHCLDETPHNKIGLQVEAATAFGSGAHGTTKGCLIALEYLKNNRHVPNNILDLGTGSGILSIALEKIWPNTKIIASDIDEESIAATNRHIKLNACKNITTIHSDGFDNDYLTKNRPYDLIIANILATPLKELSSDILKSLSDKGKIILSGMLIEQEKEILSYYNLKTEQIYHNDDWSCVVLTA